MIEPLAELEQLRVYVEELEKKCDDCNWKYRTNEAEAELEQLRRRVAVLEKIIAELAQDDICPRWFFKKSPAYFGTDHCTEQINCGDCWTAALAQAEGGE